MLNRDLKWLITVKIIDNRNNNEIRVSYERNDVTCGAPQGGILGPTLFIIFINDIVETGSSIKSFADDITALVSSNIHRFFSFLTTAYRVSCTKIIQNKPRSKFKYS